MKVIVLFCMSLIVSSTALAQQDTTSQKPINLATTTHLPYLFNTPLYVVDGLVQKGTLVNGQILNTINPDEIDNIRVIKGDSAEYLFGEPGKNGVLIITTKEFYKKSQIPKE
jgi:hypothetical protein